MVYGRRYHWKMRASECYFQYENSSCRKLIDFVELKNKIFIQNWYVRYFELYNLTLILPSSNIWANPKNWSPWRNDGAFTSGRASTNSPGMIWINCSSIDSVFDYKLITLYQTWVSKNTFIINIRKTIWTFFCYLLLVSIHMQSSGTFVTATGIAPASHILLIGSA